MGDADVSQMMKDATELLRRQRWGEAEVLLRRVVDASPEYAHGVHCLGMALAQQRFLDEAVECLKRSVELAPQIGGYHVNLAAALWDTGDSEHALESFDRAVGLDPENAGAWESYGGALAESGDVAAATQALAKAARLRPGAQALRSRLAGLMVYSPPAEAGALRKIHEAFGQAAGDTGAGQFVNERNVGRTLRVGYLMSTHLPLAAFLEPILSRHDPESIEARCFVDGPATDASARLREQVTHWLDTSAVGNRDLAARIRQENVDILVDLAGHFGSRMGLFAQRPAPVLAAYWGYPFMTGLAAMTYRITDAVADPPTAPGEGEVGVIRLPGCAAVYRPSRALAEPGALPALKAREVTFGSLNPVASLTGDVAKVWASVLAAVPKSRLLVHLPTDGHKAAATRLRGLFAARGVAAERLTFETDADRTPLYERMDVALDAFPVSDPAAVCEALWMGLPVIALAVGDVSRRSASVITAAGTGELVASDAAGYVDMARKLTLSLMQLGALRRTLRSRVRNSDLLREAPLTRRLEMAYREMWRAWCTERP